MLPALTLLAVILGAPSGRLRGTIVDRDTGKPPARASVLLECTCLPDAREFETGAGGRFAFGSLPAGRYTLSVFAGDAFHTEEVSVAPSEVATRDLRIPGLPIQYLRRSRLGRNAFSRPIPVTLDGAVRRLRRWLTREGEAKLARDAPAAVRATFLHSVGKRWLPGRSALFRWFERNGVCDPVQMKWVVVEALLRDVRHQGADLDAILGSDPRPDCVGR